jgi:hypothetical protein
MLSTEELPGLLEPLRGRSWEDQTGVFYPSFSFCTFLRFPGYAMLFLVSDYFLP